jgi:SAM-dependent methyltransferase
MAEAGAPFLRRRSHGPTRGIANRLRHALGMRQILTIAGVRYREATIEPLRHALSRKGPGYKDYDAAFAGGASMRIRCTPTRVYADLAPPRLAAVCERAESLLRPGMRVLLLEGGTGDAAAFIAGRVAPSGAVVSLDRDSESVEYAQKRYRLPNASYELGGIDGLTGETDGAFSAVIAVDPITETADPHPILTELWRVVAPGGWLMLALTPGPRCDEIVGRLGAVSGAVSGPAMLPTPKDSWTIPLVTRPLPE